MPGRAECGEDSRESVTLQWSREFSDSSVVLVVLVVLVSNPLQDALSGASQGRAETLYVECCAMIRTMWEDAKLVHGDPPLTALHMASAWLMRV